MRSFIFNVGLITFTAALVMAFEPPNNKEIHLDIGRTNDLPDSLQRALSIDDFEPIPSPRPGDWLAEHYESGQTFDEFIRSDRNIPDEIRNVIYLQPVGKFRQDQSPSLDLLRKYAGAYFLMNVEMLPATDLRRLNFTTRSNPYSQNRQILTGDVLRHLKRNLPGNAFCVLAITMEDLYLIHFMML